jgi:protein gp37
MASQRNGGVSWTNPPGFAGESWNIAIGCADRCGARCWAERQAIRQVRGRYAGLVEQTPQGPRWTGAQRFVAEKLAEPLHWREPRCVAVSLMGDLFGGGITNEQIAAVYGVMLASRRHRFVVLTKQARRRLEWHRWLTATAGEREEEAYCQRAAYKLVDRFPLHKIKGTLQCRPWPATNVIECVSCSDQETLDALVPVLIATPAAWRGVSLEPLLGPVKLAEPCWPGVPGQGLHWVIVGVESGTGPLRTKGARYCDQDWVLDVVRQCRDAGVAPHVKQLHLGSPVSGFELSHDVSLWRDELRVRQWPEVFRV